MAETILGRVCHKKFGNGSVVRDDFELCFDNEIIVRFDDIVRENYNDSTITMLFKNAEYIEIVNESDLV